ncbi:hypothetical protein C4K05_3478 [Pseudomonas chlororaphis subsp. aureofaciens]|uniref:Uncharacterized protein n=1 Tax=Pseudomonas chlororaphis subsp. aureofaciens TaxID=587851 RepID=A0AAD0ZDZ5_9PSED|nr:hypothetical protein C4K14_3546 [Pseudomonas chlororaphis subsp. aureofaciens]AZD92876.1 hypothetical protein C4K13_3459 [Pseudomonas chlororaphis subsp. aureofaciens]AZD99322.1 hypothetical protein C4K12_3456 [Pseudomonas chlororaphis subsp. aureofaciens]AZE05506.1 hypothetical protein C4K11_3344 [Pseudomonas chlororaphis subsp. aureofaciens]AZE11701.1 hypothetical protein C4K10_3421 [Pseudomonas chlororaphis subsp. aureofaciens]
MTRNDKFPKLYKKVILYKLCQNNLSDRGRAVQDEKLPPSLSEE